MAIVESFPALAAACCRQGQSVSDFDSGKEPIAAEATSKPCRTACAPSGGHEIFRQATRDVDGVSSFQFWCRRLIFSSLRRRMIRISDADHCFQDLRCVGDDSATSRNCLRSIQRGISSSDHIRRLHMVCIVCDAYGQHTWQRETSIQRREEEEWQLAFHQPVPMLQLTASSPKYAVNDAFLYFEYGCIPHPHAFASAST